MRCVHCRRHTLSNYLLTTRLTQYINGCLRRVQFHPMTPMPPCCVKVMNPHITRYILPVALRVGSFRTQKRTSQTTDTIAPCPTLAEAHQIISNFSPFLLSVPCAARNMRSYILAKTLNMAVPSITLAVTIQSLRGRYLILIKAYPNASKQIILATQNLILQRCPLETTIRTICSLVRHITNAQAGKLK